MNRRELIKSITLSSLGLVALNPQVTAAETLAPAQVPLKIPGGRQAFEAERDARLQKEKFFTSQELLTVKLLADIIIPADKHSGSASQAGVPAFIEFMMKDQPQWQTPMRGGLAWLDNKCRAFYGQPFASCAKTQQIEMVDRIAYPGLAKPDMLQGVAFFNLMRNFTASGFYSSKIGIADLGYVGNKPNEWEGVPAEVLRQYNLSYED
ncbi:MAG: gluconate 2-dehydrogenase subunit 3 family protein [Adhaeribacter sp.]